MEKTELAVLQTAILLIDGVKKSDILLKYDLSPYLKKAEEIVKVLNS